MIHFIIYEKDKKIKTVVEKILLEHNETFQISSYQQFERPCILNDREAMKFYIIDTDYFKETAFLIAKQIRKEGMIDPIFFYTDHHELYLDKILDDDMIYVSVINSKNMISKLSCIISDYIRHTKCLNMKVGHVQYKIPVKNILYVVSEKYNHHISIVTDHMRLSMVASLNELKKMLGNQFVQSHRSCLVNMDRVTLIDSKCKVIKFDNELEVDLLSNRFLKNNK